MKKYLIATLFLLISCKDNITDVINYNPLNQIEISEGNTWKSLAVLPDTGDAHHYVTMQDITVDNSNNIFVVTDFAGVFRSSDDGMTWTINNNGIEPHVPEYSLSRYFTSAIGSLGNSAFLFTANAIYESINKGDNWKLCKEWNEQVDYKVGCQFKPKNSGEIYVGCYHGIFKYTMHDKVWRDISTNFDWNVKGYAYDLEFSNDGTLYVATAKGLARTTNDGEKWEYFGIQDQTIDVEVSEKGYIFAAVYNDLYLSKDQGKTWISIFNKDSFIQYVLVNKSNTIFICCTNGVYRSHDDGVSWDFIGLKDMWPKKIFYDNIGRLIVGTGRKGVFVSQE